LYVFGALIFFGAFYMLFASVFNTPEERNLMKIQETMTQNYASIMQKYKQLDAVIGDLEERDANIYRHIFETEPPNIDAYDNEGLIEKITDQSNKDIILNTNNSIDAMERIAKQQDKVIKQNMNFCKEHNLRNLPTVQPIDNRDFRYIAATYGMRMHPFYKVLKMHTGIDFSAPLGSTVYATAAGKVTKIERNYRNTGLSVTIEHGGGYSTHYHHFNEINVRPNQNVDRMQVIGTVGNSGRVAAPHLHYEIWKDGKTCNPIHYFFGAISPEDYQILKLLEANKGQSLD
jgi:murein DD-endopeptidase MepM/ murein hydrolase activator NlpD